MLDMDGDFRASRCAGCGLLYQDPRPSPESLARHYPDAYGSYAATEIALGRSAAWHLKHCQGYADLPSDLDATPRERRQGEATCAHLLIPDHSPHGRLLEVGCAAGNRLALFQRLGWRSLVGSELSPGAAAKARARGFEVVTGPAEEAIARFPDASLQAVVAGFVLEHLPDPFAFARQVAAKLAPRGQFLFSTVNVETPDFWLYRSYWYDLDLPRHMVWFRKRDLIDMLERDFTVEDIRFESAANDYAGSARYRLRDGEGAWRWVDRLVVRVTPHASRFLGYVARLGLGARVYVRARRK
jgi:SAM-dependent methyltransferase